MIVRLLLAWIALASWSANASSVVFRSGYSKETVIQGMGNTRDEAARDALCSIPVGWELDPGNSPSWDCLKRQDSRGKLDLDGLCSSEWKGNKILFSIPLVPTDSAERRTYWDIKPWLKIAGPHRESRADGWDIKKLCNGSR